MTTPRILIGALSAWKYPERRQRCLTTWMRDADALGVPAVFLLASPTLPVPEQLGPHALVLPCPDNYASLPQRTMWFCRWALNLPSPFGRGRGTRAAGRGEGGTDWTHLFKCDDDTYISVPRLTAYDTAGRDYIGAEWRPGVAYGSGGAGYFLSRKAAAIVADRLAAYPTGPEDLLVGQVLREAGIPLSLDPRFIPFANHDRRPRADNDVITLHAFSDAWDAAHAETGL